MYKLMCVHSCTCMQIQVHVSLSICVCLCVDVCVYLYACFRLLVSPIITKLTTVFPAMYKGEVYISISLLLPHFSKQSDMNLASYNVLLQYFFLLYSFDIAASSILDITLFLGNKLIWFINTTAICWYNSRQFLRIFADFNHLYVSYIVLIGNKRS